MTPGGWAFIVYEIGGALFASHCMVEVVKTDLRNRVRSWSDFVVCVLAALVLAIVWGAVVLHTLWTFGKDE